MFYRSRLSPVSSVVVLVLLAGLLGCGAGKNDGGLPCTAEQSKASVLEIMREVYLWNDIASQVNKYSVNLQSYVDADDLLNFLRYLPDQFDRDFSYITTTSSDEQFFGEGEYPGFGFFLSDFDQGELFVAEVVSDSPAARMGMMRGDQILAIGDTLIGSGTEEEEIFIALGPPQLGVARSFDLRAQDDSLRTLDLVSALVVIDPLPITDIFVENGVMVGYLLLHTFITPAEADLRQVFAGFKMMGVKHLIVDLRYNGGGLLDVAAVFNDLLSGPSREGEVQFRVEYNARYSRFNEDVFFVQETNSIDFEKIVFIATGNSASASELVINSLMPWVDVAIVGDQTFGKPVGQGGFDFCEGELLLRAISFRLLNSDGVGNYFDGLTPDCQADDDLGYSLGDPMETSLATALTLIDTGMCPAPGELRAARTTIRSSSRSASEAARGTTPWRREARIY